MFNIGRKFGQPIMVNPDNDKAKIQKSPYASWLPGTLSAPLGFQQYFFKQNEELIRKNQANMSAWCHKELLECQNAVVGSDRFLIPKTTISENRVLNALYNQKGDCIDVACLVFMFLTHKLGSSYGLSIKTPHSATAAQRREEFNSLKSWEQDMSHLKDGVDNRHVVVTYNNDLVIDIWLGYKKDVAPFCGSVEEYAAGVENHIFGGGDYLRWGDISESLHGYQDNSFYFKIMEDLRLNHPKDHDNLVKSIENSTWSK